MRARLTLAGVERWFAERRRARSRPRGLVGCGVRRPRGCMYVRTGIQPMQPKAYAPPPIRRKAHVRGFYPPPSSIPLTSAPWKHVRVCFVVTCVSAKLHRRSVHAAWPTRRLRARWSEKGATLRAQVVFPPKRTYHQYGRRSPEGPCQACARTYSAWMVLGTVVRPGVILTENRLPRCLVVLARVVV